MACSFHRQMLRECLETRDLLCLLGRGLGLGTLLSMFVRLYSSREGFAGAAAPPLVLFLNVETVVAQDFVERAKRQRVDLLPQILDGESQPERVKMYAKGGVVFVNAQQLVLDLLRLAFPLSRCGGVLVYNAHMIEEHGCLWFALRLLREGDRPIFIKGFSDDIREIQRESRCESVMRALLVGKLHLWPRFESRIIEDLNTRQPEVVELAVPLTDRMAAMWTALHTLTIAIVDEIKKTQLVLDLPLPTMENVFQEDWHDLIQSQLGGQRNLVGDNTRNLLLDLKTMNQMRSGLLHYDCVMFNRFLETIKMEKLVNHSDWLFHDAADVLFSNAKSRVVVQPPAPLADHEGGAVFMLEPQPKWNVLREVLAEIRGENVDCNVLIVVRDQRVAMQVSGVLSKGESPWLMEQFTTSIDRGMYRARSTAPSRHSSFHGGGESKKKKAKGKGRSSSVVVPKRSIADMFPEAAKKKDSKVGKLPVAGAAPSMEEAARRDDFERSFGPMKRAIEIYSLDSGSDVASCLERLNPPFVVMYDTDLAFLRSLECYKNTAQGSSHPMRVYLLSYDVDSDDTRDLERENEGFEKLIVVKGTMLVEAERGQVVRASSPWDEVSSSRVGGGGISGGALARPYIVTDTRELKGSKIPAKLWSCGFDVNALQLEIGDYVVSNDVVIERKTVPDLISSFADGRLFKQCTNMTQHYQVVILLLEFNGSAFALQAKSKIEPHVSVAALSSKLALLALHFPKLRVFWSRDTSQSVEFIRALRASGGSALMLQHPQRDADLDRIAKTSVLSSRQGGDEVVDMTARLMLSKMPGVLAGTLDGVAQKAKTIRALCSNWNTAEYAPIMGRENAVLLGTFLTTIYAKDDDDA